MKSPEQIKASLEKRGFDNVVVDQEKGTITCTHNGKLYRRKGEGKNEWAKVLDAFDKLKDEKPPRKNMHKGNRDTIRKPEEEAEEVFEDEDISVR